MKKRLLATILAVCLVLSISATAFAVDDGLEADGPQGGGSTTPSHGTATVQGDNFDVTDDDDATAEDAEDTDGATISVWAKIAESGTQSTTIVYKLDVAWGAMQFEFNRGAGVWDPVEHAYVATGAEGANWTASYVNGINNIITVTNHTNSAIDASFRVDVPANAFNAEPSGVDAVKGNFFADNTAAQTAATVLTTVANVANATTALTLETAAAYSTDGTAETSVAADARSDEMFFAFSGTPDTDITKTAFEKVGTITVTFARNEKGYQAYVPPAEP